MIQFKPIEELHPEIEDEEGFQNSDYCDIPDAMGIRWHTCLFATSIDDEDVSEHYYFLEGNGEHIERDGDILIVQMDEVRFALLNRYDNYIIAIHKSNKEIVENLF